MSELRELKSWNRRLDRVQLEYAPPTLRMIVADLNTEEVTHYPNEHPDAEEGKVVVDEWSMVIRIDKKPENLK